MSSLSISNSKDDRNYLIAIKTESKLLEQKFITAKDALKKWNDRIDLAKQKGLISLQTEAEKKAESIQDKIKYLTEELIKLKAETENIAKTIRSTPGELSIDPDLLLANLRNLIGEENKPTLEDEIREIKSENELDKIKENLKREQ